MKKNKNLYNKSIIRIILIIDFYLLKTKKMSDIMFDQIEMAKIDTKAPAFSDTSVSATQSGPQIDFTISSRDQVNYGSNRKSVVAKTNDI